MNEHDWIHAELIHWLMRLTNVEPQRRTGATYTKLQDKVSRLAALPEGFELPDIRGIRDRISLAHERHAGAPPCMPNIPPAYTHNQRRQWVAGRLLAACIAAAGIDHTRSVTDIRAAITNSLAEHGCAALPIDQFDPCGLIDAGSVWNHDYVERHPELVSFVKV